MQTYHISMARFITLGFSIVLLILTSTASVYVILAWMNYANQGPTLRFTDNGTFQISILSTPYDGKSEFHESRPKETRQIQRLMNTVLEIEHPQLAVLDGDVIVHRLGIRENVKKVVRPLLNHDTPWVSLYVDHESDLNASQDRFSAYEQAWSNRLTRQDVNASSAGASWLPVFANTSSARDKDTPLLILWLFDSRGGYHNKQLDFNGVDETVVIWFQEKKQELRNTYGVDIPSLAFMHAPISAMAALQANATSLSDKQPSAHQNSSTESQHDAKDIAFMAVLLDTPKLIAIFSGSQDGHNGCFT